VAKNKEHEAVQDFTAKLQQITSCVSNDVWRLLSKGGGIYTLVYSQGQDLSPLELKRKKGRSLLVELTQIVEVTAKLRTTEYIYAVADADGPLVDFHYHPANSAEGIHFPHIHVYADADNRFASFHLHKKHIPSGRVALEDVIQWLIEELGVIPLKRDWKARLAASRKAFKETRSWA
jgi:hypothetical protein